ncbi:MAG: hypothetical protein NZL95_04955 [Chitinophagales bacterium]|nr:hypothetical protein [Chitinophagales bacterium]MDW8427883.1 hypothetical protein [Chitinophagales bacterium]
MPVSSSTSSSERTGRHDLRVLLRNALLLLLVVIVFDQLGGLVLRFLYFQQKSGPNAETTYLFTAMKADGLILGSSRGRRNYNSLTLADTLGFKVYNGGHDGQTVFYELAVVRSVLKRYTPKLVIIDLNPEELYYRELHYDRLNVLAPYYRDFPEVRDIYLLRGVRDGSWRPGSLFVSPAQPSNNSWDNFWFRIHAMEEYLIPINTEKIKMLSGIYPYNSMPLDILSGIFRKRHSHAGFKPLKGVISKKKAEELIRQNAALRLQPGKRVDKHKVAALEEMITLLKQRGVAVMVVMSPALAPFGMEASYQTVLDLCARHQIPFRDYSQDSTYLDLKYFYDNHMNLEGATLFSSRLASDIVRVYYPNLKQQYGQRPR